MWPPVWFVHRQQPIFEMFVSIELLEAHLVWVFGLRQDRRVGELFIEEVLALHRMRDEGA